MLIDYILIAKIGLRQVLQNVHRFLQMRLSAPTSPSAEIFCQFDDKCAARAIRERRHIFTLRIRDLESISCFHHAKKLPPDESTLPSNTSTGKIGAAAFG